MSDIGADSSLLFEHKKAKATGIGKISVDFTVGTGIYIVETATMWAEKHYPVPAEIAFNHELSDGSFIGTGFCHGWISHKNGIDITSARTVEGPGYFTGLATNLESDAVIWFEIVFRRVQ